MQTKEQKMGQEMDVRNAYHHPYVTVVNPYAVSILKPYQIHADFWGIHKNGVILVNSDEMVQFYIFASHKNDEIHAEV